MSNNIPAHTDKTQPRRGPTITVVGFLILTEGVLRNVYETSWMIQTNYFQFLVREYSPGELFGLAISTCVTATLAGAFELIAGSCILRCLNWGRVAYLIGTPLILSLYWARGDMLVLIPMMIVYVGSFYVLLSRDGRTFFCRLP